MRLPPAGTCRRVRHLQAEELIITLPQGSPAHTLLRARLDLARGRFDAVRARLGRASPGTMRDRLTGELLLARAAIESGDDAGGHVTLAVGLAAPERLVRVFLEEGPAVTRLARATADSLGTESGTDLSVALGSPPRPRGAPRASRRWSSPIASCRSCGSCPLA